MKILAPDADKARASGYRIETATGEGGFTKTRTLPAALERLLVRARPARQRLLEVVGDGYARL